MSADPRAVSFLSLDDRVRVRFSSAIRFRCLEAWQRDQSIRFEAPLVLLAALVETTGLRRRYRADARRRRVQEGEVDPWLGR